MKRIKFIIIIFVVSLVAGCQSNLLDTTPYNSIGSTAMWTTESLADLGVTGVYQTLRQDYVGLNRWYFDQDGFTGMNRGATALTNGNVTTSDGLFVNYWKQN